MKKDNVEAGVNIDACGIIITSTKTFQRICSF